jgi:SAM-dependent methyltransferase
MPKSLDFDRHFDAQVYDKEYFEGFGYKSGYTSYLDAERVVRDLFIQIDRVMRERVDGMSHLDVGCAYGFGCSELWERGWSSKGIDISSYAVEQGEALWGDSPPIVLADARTYLKSYSSKLIDLITGVEFFEHIESSDVSSVIADMAKAAHWGFFLINASVSPTTKDPERSKGDHGHLNHHPFEWWVNQFSSYGELDWEAMYEFNKMAEDYNEEMAWHCRGLVVKFD